MLDLRIGDRVLCVEESDGNCLTTQATGTVAGFGFSGEIAVEFDEDIEGHDCCGSTVYGHGWWVDAEILELISETDEEDAPDQIDILFNDIMFK